MTLLAAAAAGAWAGWRAARSGVVGFLAPAPAPQRSAASRSLLPPTTHEVVDKLVALLELGRERGLEVFQSVLGGRTGHAA